MHVVLDTNIYRGDAKRASAGFRALALLGSLERITIHVPHYVYKEYVTQQEDELQKAIEKIKHGATTLTRLSDHEEVARTAEVVREKTDLLQKDLILVAAVEFDAWLAEAHAMIQPLPQDHGQRMTDAYFAGTAPFGSRKNRNDIPDAFIYETIKDLTAAHGEVHAIIGDTNLRKACGALPNIRVYATIDDFVATPGSQALLASYQSSAAHWKLISSIRWLKGRFTIATSRMITLRLVCKWSASRAIQRSASRRWSTTVTAT